MLSFLNSLPISVFHSLDTDANLLYNSTHQLYDADLLLTKISKHRHVAITHLLGPQYLTFIFISLFLTLIQMQIPLIHEIVRNPNIRILQLVMLLLEILKSFLILKYNYL